jgi:hypothetical protein
MIEELPKTTKFDKSFRKEKRGEMTSIGDHLVSVQIMNGTNIQHSFGSHDFALKVHMVGLSDVKHSKIV